MKKFTVIVIAMLLLLCAGCAKSEPTETAPAITASAPATEHTETTVPETEPLPQTENGVILADHVPAVLAILHRGDVVDVVGEYDELHYIIKLEQGYGLVEKQLLAMEGTSEYEAWVGYSKWNKNVYDSHRLCGTPVSVLKTNTKVEILDDLGNCYVVVANGLSGFMRPEDVSRSPIRSQNSSGGGGDGGSSRGADGGDISLQVNGGIVLLSAVKQEGTVSGKATVRANGTEVVLGYFEREEVAQIVVESGFAEIREGFHTVLMDDLYAYVSTSCVRLESEEVYTQWDGFAKYNTMFYDNFYLCGEGRTLTTNTAVHVIADLEQCYLVSVEEQTGYISKEFVSEKRIVSKKSSDGGAGGKEWSDPVM